MTTPAATALLDQVHAASRHAQQTLRAAAARDPRHTFTTAPADPWTAQQINHLRHLILTGQATYCPHLGPTPALAQAAVWAPGRIVCVPCAPTLRPGPAEDITCDRCRRLAGLMHPCVTAIGPVLLAYGLCTTCFTNTNQKGNRR